MEPIQIGQHLFTPEVFQQAIAATANLAEGKKGALIGAVDTSGAHAAIVVRITDHVEVQGAFNWQPGTTNISAGGAIIASWP